MPSEVITKNNKNCFTNYFKIEMGNNIQKYKVSVEPNPPNML